VGRQPVVADGGRRGDGVDAGGLDLDVVAVATVEDVEAATTDEDVVTGAALEHVVTGATDEDIVAGATDFDEPNRPGLEVGRLDHVLAGLGFLHQSR
jgi:hypothetical protein